MRPLAWNPVLVRKVEIEALGFLLLKLQLNRHRNAEVAAHRHPHAQVILYLAGEGVQQIAGRHFPAAAGDLFVIPGRTPHGFLADGASRQRTRAAPAHSHSAAGTQGEPPLPHRAPKQLPLCLVLDYRESPSRHSVRRGARGSSPRPTHRRLPQSALNELHALLARLPIKRRLRLADYSVILAVVARLMEAGRRGASPAVPSAAEQVLGLFGNLPDPAPSLAAIARKAGLHRDHLTRRLRRETGLGLRGHRDRLRLATAQEALLSSFTVAEAAESAGFGDPNYFARWFRRRTDKTPTEWRRGQRRNPDAP